ncbi:hypothetical protein [uncultured Polaribacter sp.]|uniref:hypothetical protein n=1 Tax=uncultured Polaribacter sp. TaxID=174711 RepID=UPI002615B441|nr:hypothetical protein [uncultured Polaribacter sp.]
MRNIFVFFILIFTINIQSQVELDIYFFDECENELKKVEFELIDSNFNLVEFKKNTIDSIGVYTLATKLDIKNGDYGVNVFKILKIEKFGKYTDTINVPKIRFVTSNVLHSTYWSYYKCSKICNGKEVDYFSNGNIRLQGNFKNGKPNEIKEYNEKGELLTQTYYKNYNLKFNRINYFNKNGKLREYEIYKYKKRKTIIKTFNKKGKLINKEIE